MGELITTLGIDGKLLIAQLVNFLVLFFLLRKFLFSPLLSKIEERRKKAQDILQKESELSSSQHRIQEEKEEILLHARTESQAIIESARKRAVEVTDETIRKAQQDAQYLISKTEQELQNRKVEFDSALKKSAGELIETSLKKVIPQVITKDIDEKIVKDALKDMS